MEGVTEYLRAADPYPAGAYVLDCSHAVPLISSNHRLPVSLRRV